MIDRLFKSPNQSFFLFGPRGTGKSTWVAGQYPRATRIDLLDDGVFREFSANPNRLLSVVRGSPPRGTIVIDEVQKLPALLSLVHLLMEEKKGWTFVLTGSNARKLKRAGVDLLGGRALLCHMHPFMSAELNEQFHLEKALQTGLLPLVWDSPEPKKVLSAYIGLYLREEVKMEGLVRQVEDFSHFLETMAFSHGGLLNLNNTARETHVKRSTIDSYMKILEDLLLSYKVRVFTKRAKRELVGHDKFYFFDTGVFQALRRRGPFDQSGEIEGQALEGLVAQHLRAWNSYGENEHEITYWRTRWGVEVDFVVYGPSGIWALEVKSSDRVKSEDLRGVNAFLDDYPEAKGILLYRGTARLKEGRIHCLPVENFLRGLTPQKELV
ncbi:MAG: ATP-binding protein [Elusimicrobia bacterium]|nr:ATP-binding protein [Elusimicrobiota bacterium]